MSLYKCFLIIKFLYYKVCIFTFLYESFRRTTEETARALEGAGRASEGARITLPKKLVDGKISDLCEILDVIIRSLYRNKALIMITCQKRSLVTSGE